MAKINYTFADGHTEEIEVSDEFALQYELLEDDWKRQEEREKKRRRRRLSFEGLVESGYEFEDTTCADPLERIIEQESEKFSLISLSYFLTARQKHVMQLYYEVGMSKREIADALGVDESSIRECLNWAVKKILKNF